MSFEHTYNKKREWRAGLVAGFPIFLGYLAVSFGIGILSVRAGMNPLQAVLLSVTNVTSAGQAAGIGIIATAGTYPELALSQFVINLRYSLMSLSLSQKMDRHFQTPQRLLIAYGVTDEVFALSSTRPKKITPSYMYGMILISVTGWVSGTLLGAVAGELLPARITGALGILLYAMFLAIILPPARKDRRILFVVALAAGLHLIFYFFIPAISRGFAIIICGLTASVVAALLFPTDARDEKDTSGISLSENKEKEGCPQ